MSSAKGLAVAHCFPFAELPVEDIAQLLKLKSLSISIAAFINYIYHSWSTNDASRSTVTYELVRLQIELNTLHRRQSIYRIIQPVHSGDRTVHPQMLPTVRRLHEATQCTIERLPQLFDLRLRSVWKKTGDASD